MLILLYSKKQIHEDKELSDEQKQEKLEKIDSSSVKFVCAVDNPTCKIGHHLNIWIFDSLTRSFLECDFGKEWIEEKGHELFQISEPYSNLDEVKKNIAKQYGSDVDFIYPLLEVGAKSYIALVFRDIEGRLYMVKRGVIIDKDGDIGHSSSAMHFAV